MPRTSFLGMPLSGQAFTLKNADNTGLQSPGSKGQAGEFTRAAGFLAYYEICHKIKNEGYQVVEDPEHRMGPYAFKGRQWVGFDDQDMIRRKVKPHARQLSRLDLMWIFPFSLSMSARWGLEEE